MAERKTRITREHIMQGERKECSRCPLALAIAEQLKPGHRVRAAPWTIWVDRMQTRSKYVFRHDGSSFIAAFDAGGDPGPTTITLRCKGPMPDIWLDDVTPAESE